MELDEKYRMLFKKCKSLLMDYGLGVILSHRNDRKEECPIAFASRTLTEAEKRYSQLEKEALSITYGDEKSRQYLLGRKFVLVTDNRPLIHIFSPQKPIPICAASRIKRGSLKLAAFNYTEDFRKGSDNSNVDALSRLPLESSVREFLDEDQVLLLRKLNEVFNLAIRSIKAMLMLALATIATFTEAKGPPNEALKCLKQWSYKRFVLDSPNYPQTYPDDAKCKYTVRKNVDCGNKAHLNFTFLDFDIKPSQDCKTDFLELEGRRYCNSALPPNTLSREKVNDDQHTGRPRSLRCEENKLKIKELIKSNRIISIKDLYSETGLSVGLCHQIETKDLDMIRTSSKFVPRILTEEQKEVRMDVCKNMVEMTRTDPEWMQKIITGDETWVYQYDPETKPQSSQWIERGEPKPKKARFTKSKDKTLLVSFFYINGLVHHEFIPFGRTINQEVYLGIMRRLREAVRLKTPERWQNNDWILHVDNARPHTAHVVLQFLAKHSTIQIPHPPYSPDLSPNDFFLYPKLKMKLKGRKFDNVDMIQAESKATLRNL
ncbi:hypothetical protein LAZ67_20002368 [Cordylochernes scorpioides]|uniref:CUB domain-containing protein n=1 Tax=Cordylochernes scorpioides TaxID=51811 RepID=A0ABY6LL27_9ARAC|nr:hypothetical protein LAZ67_20002368 [Cordylochernes scorpioides]